ncbi:response regulator [Anaerobacillus alkaliphilus]|uniref:Circadian input-output histidine kinase CikA n=1 Tax=Anaerobacillus alkaliphilus TaxID=1548597 RepID=A0A4V1LG16_9BACI|nr:response regulator [Anaerobacillus alkaliphilus]RXI98194.1 response regulator [Anaerobacillus alkaliphilus]
MKLKTKLYLGFGTILVILVLISSIVLYTLNTQKNNLEVIVQNSYERVSIAQALKSNAQTKARFVREFFLNDLGEKDYLEEELKITKLIEKSNILFNELSVLGSSNLNSIELVRELEHLNGLQDRNIAVAIELLKEGSYDEAKTLIIVDNASILSNLISGMDLLTETEEEAMEQLLENSLETYQSTLVLFVILVSISFVIVIGITTSVIRSFSVSLNNVRNVMMKIPHQSFDNIPRIKTELHNEFDDVAKAYNEMAEALERYASTEKNYQSSLEEENWLKTQFADVTTSFQGAQKLSLFGKIFVSKMATTVNATYGMFYFKEDKGYRGTATYAAEQEDITGDTMILKGEGLVGQCALNNRVILLDHLPSDYIVTKSGLGKASPTHLMLLPIQFEGEVLGVLELAKFETFTPLQQRLLEQVCLSLGPNLDRIQYHMEIERLLAESQVLTEELQAQSEELQQQQEELRTINEDLYKENILTEEKTKELEKIKSDLEQKNREILLSSKYKTEFLANMSHELRTPLNSMLILSEILSENNDRNLSKKQIEYAQTIHTSGKDLLNLINDILDLSKVESGKLEIFPEEVEVDEIEAFVQRQFTPIASQKNLNFEIVIDSNIPKIIITDDQRLKQILKNLLSNAFKFTNKGKVTLHVHAGSKETNSKLIFSVIDTGIGIPSHKQQVIFEAFNQLDGTTSRKYGGTGLGLSISKELAQLLGGYLAVRSEEGEGSNFSLYLPDLIESKTYDDLPLVAATVEDTMEIVSSSADHIKVEDLSNKTVLIVDDDMRNVFALTSILEKEKMNVLYAENGLDAIKKLEATKIDIVLMDIMMPKMNGYETMTEIRKNEKLKDIPIIALTAKAMKTDRQKCISAGASDYISKPVDLNQLLSLIRVWLYK